MIRKKHPLILLSVVIAICTHDYHRPTQEAVARPKAAPIPKFAEV